MPSLWPSVPTGTAPAMTFLRRVFGLAETDDERVAPPVAPSTSGPGIHIKGEVHGEGTLVIHGVLKEISCSMERCTSAPTAGSTLM